MPTWIQKYGKLILAAGLIAMVLFLGYRSGRQGDSTENPAPMQVTEGEEGQAGKVPKENSAEGMSKGEEAEQRVAREGKILEGWTDPPCIVVDPGHGGFDPGKVGINQVPEKDVNLQVALLLREYLEAAGVKVVMTRTEDISLCGEGSENKKVKDLKERIRVIEEAKPAAVVSVHQNSYPQESICGAQVFYYENSVQGEKLAKAVQERLIREADPENDRQIKANTSYFLLKKTSVPIIIAECGFLSNRKEADKLCTEEYQDTIAWAVYLGVMDYLEQNK